jgi:branched-chain amino acid transport system ATP-binding protein
MSALLEVRGLSRHYRALAAVDDLSFDVPAGSITGLIGPNGSGKSTTIDCLTGFQPANAGRWTLDGLTLHGKTPQAMAQAGLTRTFQAVRVYDALSLLDNLRLAAQASDGTGWADALLQNRRWRAAEAAADARARDLLGLVGLLDFANAPAERLSYGQRKLLQLAAAVMARPKLVMLDEPVAGVNPTMILRIGDILRRLRNDGVTLVVVEHNVDFIVGLCDRVIVLAAGRKLAEGPPSLIRSDPAVLAAYLGTGRKRRA